MVSQKKENIAINENTLLTRKEVCNILHIGLSSFDSLKIYKELKRVKLGRHTFVLQEDLMKFILDHRDGGKNE